MIRLFAAAVAALLALNAPAKALPRGEYLYCPKGSHMATYDDQAAYFAGLPAFLHRMA